MKSRITSISEILNDNLTLIERGILITILLLKDDDPKITLAKCKVKIKFQNVRKELINLHEMKHIEWSGYKAAIKAEQEKEVNVDLVYLIDFMNGLYRRDFDVNSKSSTTNLLNRLTEHSVEDIKLVISNRYAVWNGDKVMEKHLNPTTIFRPSKFDKYLEEAKRTKQGESFVVAHKNNLKDGDEITSEIAKILTDDVMYSITTYRIGLDQVQVGTGTVSNELGKAIKSALRFQDSEVGRGGPREFIYKYKAK
jgi:uncharacterized phage protein (TIGR02220 family)